jgi:hypothetical protein
MSSRVLRATMYRSTSLAVCRCDTVHPVPSLLRRLAREAVIFMLAGLLLTAIGFFAYRHHSEAVSVQVRRIAERKRSGECVTKAMAQQANAQAAAEAMYSVTSRADAKTMSEKEILAAETKALNSMPLNPVLSAGTFDMPDECIDRSQQAVPVSNWVLAFIPIIQLYGFFGGFGVWLFYRLVRFAVKG